MVAAAHGNKEIARRFAVSEETIKHHLTRLFAKVGASTRLELAMLATQHGIVAPEPDVDVPLPAADPHLLPRPSSSIRSAPPIACGSPPQVPHANVTCG